MFVVSGFLANWEVGIVWTSRLLLIWNLFSIDFCYAFFVSFMFKIMWGFFLSKDVPCLFAWGFLCVLYFQLGDVPCNFLWDGAYYIFMLFWFFYVDCIYIAFYCCTVLQIIFQGLILMYRACKQFSGLDIVVQGLKPFSISRASKSNSTSKVLLSYT